MNKIISYTFFLSVLIVVSCEKDQFLGPPLESLYGELQVTRGERLIDSTNFSIFQVFGVDLSMNDTLRLDVQFSIPVNYNVSIKQSSSGAEFLYEGYGSDMDDFKWTGQSENLFFKKTSLGVDSSLCVVSINFPDFDVQELTDTFWVFEEKNLNDLGLFICSYEDDSEYQINMPSSEITSADILTGPYLVPHGSMYAQLSITSDNTYYGGEISLNISSIDIENYPLDDIYINLFFLVNPEHNNTSFLIKIFEENGESFKTNRLVLNSNGQWNKVNVKLSDLYFDDTSSFVDNQEIDITNLSNLKIILNSLQGSPGTYTFATDLVFISYQNPI